MGKEVGEREKRDTRVWSDWEGGRLGGLGEGEGFEEIEEREKIRKIGCEMKGRE